MKWNPKDRKIVLWLHRTLISLGQKYKSKQLIHYGLWLLNVPTKHNPNCCVTRFLHDCRVAVLYGNPNIDQIIWHKIGRIRYEDRH